jgi:hypothetical protein
MRRPELIILVLVLASSATALADEESTPVIAPADPDALTTERAVGPAQPLIPPGIDYPGIVDRGPRLWLYVDYTYESTNDLATFWWVQGRGTNYRFAVGGGYRVGGLVFHGEVPIQYTQLTIDSLMQQPPIDADRSKAAVSLGDINTDAAYFWDLPSDALLTHVGLGLRVRWPTHTTKYRFSLIDGSTIEFGFPYYLHLAPAALLSTSYGPVFLVVNEGVLAMLAKDVTLGGILQRIPNIYFHESHVAAGLAATDWLAFTVELVSFIQLNRVDVEQMTNLNDTRALFLNPAVSLDLGQCRVALAWRFGLSGRSSRDFGVITFSGSRAFLARLSYLF